MLQDRTGGLVDILNQQSGPVAGCSSTHQSNARYVNVSPADSLLYEALQEGSSLCRSSFRYSRMVGQVSVLSCHQFFVVLSYWHFPYTLVDMIPCLSQGL
jgi:hypothetical protein